MGMDIAGTDDGRQQVRLGPVERWIVILCATALVGMLGWYGKTASEKQDDFAQRLSKIDTQQAVANAQLAGITAQLSDVPNLTQKIAELRVQTDRNTKDIEELRATRGLK